MQPHGSTRSQCTDVLPSMDNLEAAFHPPAKEASFYTAVEKRQSNRSQTSCKAVLNQEGVRAPGTVPKVHGEDVTENPFWNIKDLPETRCNGDKSKTSMKHLVIDGLATVFE